MKDGFKVFGVVEKDGTFRVYNKGVFLEKVKRFAGRYVELEMTERSNSISNPLRSYYFAVVVKEWRNLFHYLGDPRTVRDTDEFLRGMFLFKEEYNEESDTYSRELHRLSSAESEVTQIEFKFFIEQCIQFAAEFDWPIPYPNEIIN